MPTGLSVRHWRRQAERGFHRSPARKAPPSGKGKPFWYVHRSLDSRLTRYPKTETREDRERTALLTRYPQHVVERVYRKAHWLRKWRTACDRSGLPERELAERVVTEARTVEGDGFAICVRSLQAWQRAYFTPGPTGRIHSIEALIDGRAAPTRTGDGDDGALCLPSGRDPRAVEYFYGLYHTENKLGVVTCHEMTLSESRAKGWHWSGSYSATRKWLSSHDNVSLSFLLRSGKDAWCRRYMPHIEIDYSLIEPGQMFQTDHHQCDFWVVGDDGKPIRPWLTVVQDMRTRSVVG